MKTFGIPAFGLMAAFLVACGGGGGGGGGSAPVVAPVIPPPVTTSSSQITVSSSGGAQTLPSVGGFNASVSLSSNNASGSASVTATSSTTVPAGLPVLQSNVRQPKSTATVLFYEAFVSPVTITFTSFPGFTIALPSTVVTAGQQFYVGLYTASGWVKGIEGPATASGGVVTFAPSPVSITLTAGVTYYFAFYSLPAPANPLTVSPASLSFLGTGAGFAQTITVTESGYTGSFTPSTICTGVATVAAGTSSNTFSATPTAAGSCEQTFADSNGNTVGLPITVTTTTVGGS